MAKLPKNYICPSCKQPKAYNRKCQKCKVDVVPRDEYEKENPPDYEPSEDELDQYEAEDEAEADKIHTIKPTTGKKIGKKDFKQLWKMPFDFINKWLGKVDDDSDYRELAEIWMFDDDEIDDMLDFAYMILAKYFPKALIWMAGEAFMILIFNGITIFLIFGKKIKKTVIFFAQRRKQKQEVIDIDSGKPAATA